MDLTSTENEAAKKAKKADKWADKPAMEVRDLHFAYGKNKVLKGVSLKIEEGKITTIMGANGCGKSTLFSLMTKNLYPGKGNIFLKGKNIQNLNLKEFARKVAIVQQYNSASDDITVENLVAFGRTPHKKMMQGDSAEDERMIEWALEVTNLTEYRDREVPRLSGGQRQRVWIAMALCQGTKTLFLDEPTTYLDIRYQIEILQLVKKLNQEFGITIIMVLHDINQAIAYSDNVIGMKDGKVLVEGDPEEVITEAPERVCRNLVRRLGIPRVADSRKPRSGPLPHLARHVVHDHHVERRSRSRCRVAARFGRLRPGRGRDLRLDRRRGRPRHAPRGDARGAVRPRPGGRRQRCRARRTGRHGGRLPAARGRTGPDLKLTPP